MRTRPGSRVSRVLPATLLGVWALAAPATADVWDVGPPGSNADNSLVSTLNVFAHGALQLHDLAGLTTPTTICPAPPCPDRDWYVVLSPAYTSHEVIIEAVSPNAAPGLAPPGLTRHDAAGTLLQQAQILGTGTIAPSATASLRWEGPGLGGVDYVAVAQVDPPSCGALCDSTAQYTLRYYETTGAIPRFNNSGDQVTVVILQNTSNDPPPTGIITGNINFFVGGSPTPVQVPFSIVETSGLVLNSASVPGLGGQAGRITISHNGRFGQLVGKAIAVEPATGFTFDTPMEYKPR